MCNSKFNSNMPFFSHALVLVCVSDIQPPTTKENHQNQKLLIDIKALEEKVASLEEERDFLRETYYILMPLFKYLFLTQLK